MQMLKTRLRVCVFSWSVNYWMNLSNSSSSFWGVCGCLNEKQVHPCLNVLERDNECTPALSLSLTHSGWTREKRDYLGLMIHTLSNSAGSLLSEADPWQQQTFSRCQAAVERQSLYTLYISETRYQIWWVQLQIPSDVTHLQVTTGKPPGV